MSFQWISWLNNRSIHLKIWFNLVFFLFFVVVVFFIYDSGINGKIDWWLMVLLHLWLIFSLIHFIFFKIARNIWFLLLPIKTVNQNVFARKKKKRIVQCSVSDINITGINPQKHATVMFGTWQIPIVIPIVNQNEGCFQLETGSVVTHQFVWESVHESSNIFRGGIEYMNWNVD